MKGQTTIYMAVLATKKKMHQNDWKETNQNLNAELKITPSKTGKGQENELIPELILHSWQGPLAVKMHLECKQPLRASGVGSARLEGSASVLWQNPKSRALFYCPVQLLGLRAG